MRFWNKSVSLSYLSELRFLQLSAIDAREAAALVKAPAVTAAAAAAAAAARQQTMQSVTENRALQSI